MLTPLLLSTIFVMSEPTKATLELSASLPAGELTIGEEYEIDLSMVLSDGWSASKSGIPQPFLQIEVPDSAQLSGKVLTGYRELARNEFVQEPFERLIDLGTTSIKFTLTEAPKEGEYFALNVIAYIKQSDANEHYYVRRRLHLPLVSGAIATETDASETAWGEHETLKVGEKADDFTLPQFGGSSISLSDYKGKKNVILTTYRAFW